MSEELLQRNLVKNPEKIGKWDFYNIGATTVRALKEYRIIRSIDYWTEEKKKVDALIVQRKNVIAIIEYKKPSEFKTEAQKQKAINQEIKVAKKLGSKIIIATDTKESIWVNTLTGKRIKDESGKEINTIFDPKDEKIAELIEKIDYSINETNNSLKPKKLVNPTDLAKQIWQDVWSVSGATPENCLYTFIELFIFKYLSDLWVLKGMYSFSKLMKSYDDNESDEVLNNYASIVRPKIKELFPCDPIDKTTIINGTIFVSKDQKAVAGYSTVFRKVLEKFENYGKLEHIEPDFKSQLFESFLKESISKKNWGQFFTPLKVIRAITKIAQDDIKPWIKICDPACGVGKFLLEPIWENINELFPVKNNKLESKITIHGYDKGFDKDEQKTIILAKANMLIYFSDLIKENPNITNQFATLFNNSFTLKTNSILWTLSDPVENMYDLILTNPPYVTSWSSNLKEEIKKDWDLVNYYKINAMWVEGLFMEWIIKSLKPWGSAFIVIPDWILNRKNDKNLRKYILDECNINGIISLPLNTFFTTPKKTYILCITKKIDKKKAQSDPIFTYLVSEIWEARDITRFDIDQNDLEEAVTLFKFFKWNKKDFEKINTDGRCKIQKFDKFEKNINNSWVIDSWWSNEEKVNMWIIDKEEKVTLLEYASIIEGVADSIKEFQVEVRELAQKKKSKIIYKPFILKDLFTIERGLSKYTKKYIDGNKWNYSVYSGNTFGSFSHINEFDYDKPCLSWAIDGLAGYIMIHDEKFSATNHRGILQPKDDNINLVYTKFILEPIFRKAKKGRIGTDWKNEYTALPPFMISDIEFQMPVDTNGSIDIKAQENIVEKINFIKDAKRKIDKQKKKLNELIVNTEDVIKNNEIIKIENIFDLSAKTNNSKFTKAFINKHKGAIPVYSASKFPFTVDYGYVKDNLKWIKYFENCLTWNIDWSIWKAHYRKERFSLSEKVIPLIISADLQNKLDIHFLKYTIENEFSKHSFGFGNKAWKWRIKDIEIFIPVDQYWEFDLQSQKEIAEKYIKVERIKSAINLELDKISEIEIDL